MSVLYVAIRSAAALVRRVPVEAWIWAGGLLLMASFDPRAEGLTTLCLFHHLGFEFCPGCGLGHAVAFLARGDVQASLAAHPLGIPVVAGLLVRIATLVREEHLQRSGRAGRGILAGRGTATSSTIDICS